MVLLSASVMRFSVSSMQDWKKRIDQRKKRLYKGDTVLLLVKGICRCCSNRHLGQSLARNIRLSQSPEQGSHPCWISWHIWTKGICSSHPQPSSVSDSSDSNTYFFPIQLETQIVTKLKKIKLWQNSNTNCNKTQKPKLWKNLKLKLWQNSKTQIVTKL